MKCFFSSVAATSIVLWTLWITSCDAFAFETIAYIKSSTAFSTPRDSDQHIVSTRIRRRSASSFISVIPPANRRHRTYSALHAKSNSKEETTKSIQLDVPSLKRLVQEALAIHDQNLSCTPPLSQIASRLSDLETESSDPSFWEASNASRSAVVTRDIAKYTRLKEELLHWDKLRHDAEDALELLQDLLQEQQQQDASSQESTNEMIQLTFEECQSSAQTLFASNQKYELQTLLSGPYDASPCTLLLTAGAGGTESCDWVDMLYRMYTRHAQHMGYRTTVLDSTPGDVVGYKSVELSIECDNSSGGLHPYGWFKGEKGAHRLVRLSPFNANNKRQTTFAGVDVVPILEEEEVKDIDIPEKELEITTMRSGGKGGQNVNKVETGVRIKHLPTGLSVKCTEERSQSQNKQTALSRLKGQLLVIAQEQRLEDIKSIRGDIVEASWGAQIRNYVMQPYKLVKDGRSGWETSDVDGFLDGGSALEDCVGSLLRWRRRVEEEEREESELKGVQ